MEDTKETRYWYDFAMTNTSGFLLRMFCKKVQDDKHIYFVSEKFDCTMNQFKKPSLWDYRTKRLDQDFTRILLCQPLSPKIRKRFGSVMGRLVKRIQFLCLPFHRTLPSTNLEYR
ncbi:hypothetical protein LguiA_027027 [Lonicera macranthoides]